MYCVNNLATAMLLDMIWLKGRVCGMFSIVYFVLISVMTDGVFISCSGFENSVLMCPLLNLTQCSKFVLLKCEI